jgi:hypothetical protein
LNNEKEHGVFELRTPEDLLGKLRVDLKRLEADPLDQYAAFDFFVSASHMPDWLSPGQFGGLGMPGKRSAVMYRPPDDISSAIPLSLRLFGVPASNSSNNHQQTQPPEPTQLLIEKE